jgi:hypothetical protein
MFGFESKVRDGRKTALRRLIGSAVLPCAAALALTLSALACGGETEDVPPGCGGGFDWAEARSVFVRDGDVYVGGLQWDPSEATPNANPLAVLWRNGEVHRRIPESDYIAIKPEWCPEAWKYGHFNGRVGVPFLAGDGSVYAPVEMARPYWNPEWTTALRSSSTTVAGFWKDGELHYLDVPDDDGSASIATSIFVSDDNDVYAIGAVTDQIGDPVFTPKHAILWKNGRPSRLNEGGKRTYPNSLFVSGGDVYVAGVETDYELNYLHRYTNWSAVLWKNGERQRLEGDGHGSTALAVFVQGEDVYAAGYVGRDTVVWKNGAIAWVLPADGDYYHGAISIFVSGEDVYVPGRVDSHPVIWKNGEATVLPVPPPQVESIVSSGGCALGVSVQGDDVYVTGLVGARPTSHYYTPAVWKNGVLQELPLAKEERPHEH